MPVIAANIDKVITFQMLGAQQLATYNFAIAAPDQLRGPLKIAQTVALPKLAEKKQYTAGRELWGRLWRLMLVFSVPMLIYMIGAPLLYHIFFKRYLDAIGLSQVYSLSLMFLGPVLYMQSILQAHTRTKAMYHYNIATSIVQILLMVPLTYYFLLPGLVISRVISSIINFIYLAILIQYDANALPPQNIPVVSL
jgi:O-antigen/teichoic acid export membrane protein